MFDWIIRTSLRHRWTVIAFYIALALAAGPAVRRAIARILGLPHK